MQRGFFEYGHVCCIFTLSTSCVSMAHSRRNSSHGATSWSSKMMSPVRDDGQARPPTLPSYHDELGDSGIK